MHETNELMKHKDLFSNPFIESTCWHNMGNNIRINMTKEISQQHINVNILFLN